MSASDAFENAILKLLFGNVAFTNIGDAGGLQPSVADGDFYVSLHTSDPGEAGNQTSNECAYTSYARVAVDRTTGWTVSGNNVENAAAITFPQATGGSETATHFAIGTAASGPGVLLFSGTLDSPLEISSGITPEFASGVLDVTAD